MSPKPRTEKLYTVNHAAAELDVSPLTIRRWIKVNKIRVERIAGTRMLRVPASEIARQREART